METAFYLAKLLIIMIGIWLIGTSSRGDSVNGKFYAGCSLLGLALFLTGVEFMSPEEHAWTYWLFEANPDEYSKAFIGGCMMLAFPLGILALCGKDIINLSKNAK